MVDETEIERKQNKKNGAKENQKNHWLKFMYSCIGMLILTIMIGLINSNFVYFTRLGEYTLNYLFPTEMNDFFPENTQNQMGGRKRTRRGGGGHIDLTLNPLNTHPDGDPQSNKSYPKDGSCPHNAKSTKPTTNTDTFYPISKYFPYRSATRNSKLPPATWGSEGTLRTLLGGEELTDKQKSYNEKGGVQKITDWLAYTTAPIDTLYGMVIKNLLKFFDPDKTSETLIFMCGTLIFSLIISLCLFPVIPVVIWVLTAGLGIYNGLFKPGGFITAIFCSCFLWWVLAFLSATWFPLKYFLTFTLSPLRYDPKGIRNIFSCNKETLVLIFSALCIISAIIHLSWIIPTVMSILWILNLVRLFFKKD